MKTLHELLSESILDANFDVNVEDIYADNIISKVLEIMSVRKFKDYDKIVKELHDLLKSAARGRQEQDTSSIQRRFRSNDNISIYMEKEGAGFTSISIQKLIKRKQFIQVIINTLMFQIAHTLRLLDILRLYILVV